jgi:hypothetical protein
MCLDIRDASLHLIVGHSIQVRKRRYSRSSTGRNVATMPPYTLRLAHTRGPSRVDKSPTTLRLIRTASVSASAARTIIAAPLALQLQYWGALALAGGIATPVERRRESP